MPTALELMYDGNYVCTHRARDMNGGDLFEYKGDLYYVHPQTDLVCKMESGLWAWC